MGTFTISFQGDGTALGNLAKALTAIADLIAENQQGKVDELATTVAEATKRLHDSNTNLWTELKEAKEK